MTGSGIRTVEAGALAGRPLRYFDVVMAAFVTILLLSNVIGAGKLAAVDLPWIGPWAFGAGILFFPISYVIGDVLTEVYGFRPGPPLHLGGLRGDALHGVHGLGGGRAAAGRDLGRPGGL